MTTKTTRAPMPGTADLEAAAGHLLAALTALEAAHAAPGGFGGSMAAAYAREDTQRAYERVVLQHVRAKRSADPVNVGDSLTLSGNGVREYMLVGVTPAHFELRSRRFGDVVLDRGTLAVVKGELDGYRVTPADAHRLHRDFPAVSA